MGIPAVLLIALGKGVASYAGKKGLEELSNRLFGGKQEPSIIDNVLANKEKLDQILTEFKELDIKLRGLENTVNDGFFQITENNAKELLDYVSSMYNMYTSAIKGMTDINPNKAPTANRDRVTKLGLMIASDLYPKLESIHSYLAGQNSTGNTLLAMAVAHSARTSSDLIVHYAKMRMYFYNYTAVQIKGTFLLQCAYEDPQIPFQDGLDNIARIDKNLEQQEKYFTHVFGVMLQDLAIRIIKEPDVPVTCYLRPDGFSGTSIGIGDQDRISGKYNKVDLPEFWLLEWLNPLKPDAEVDINTEYGFWLRHVRRYDAVGPREDKPWRDLRLNEGYWYGSWKLKPTPSNRVRLQWRAGLVHESRGRSYKDKHFAVFKMDNLLEYSVNGPAYGEKVVTVTPDDHIEDTTQWFDITIVDEYILSNNKLLRGEVMLPGMSLANGDWRLDFVRRTGQLQIVHVGTKEVKWRAVQLEPKCADVRLKFEDKPMFTYGAPPPDLKAIFKGDSGAKPYWQAGLGKIANADKYSSIILKDDGTLVLGGRASDFASGPEEVSLGIP